MSSRTTKAVQHTRAYVTAVTSSQLPKWRLQEEEEEEEELVVVVVAEQEKHPIECLIRVGSAFLNAISALHFNSSVVVEIVAFHNGTLD